jgi:ABC-2 type transport system ATP-binding protein
MVEKPSTFVGPFVDHRPMSEPEWSGRLADMIEVVGLTKRYGAHTAVDDVSFRVEPGTVTGFLGPNGAGKSTTMRMMCGLTPPSAGEATILGLRYRDIPNPGTRVGVLLDASAQHAGRTGREVLTLSAKVMGLPSDVVDERLELVGLSPAEAKRRVGNYSLGMRQRLGIANALLADPQVLILDEPANGLDPAGIHWMRRLLRDFAERGGTALLSSHLLHEVEVIADELVVIGRGRIVARGSKTELLAGQGTLVRGADEQALAAALERAALEFTAHPHGGFVVDSDARSVGAAAVEARVVLTELRPADGAGLEDMFLQLTADDAREEVSA